MTVLRSRKVLSTVSRKPSQPLHPENVVVEPMTPAKSSEVLSSLSNNTSPSSSSVTQNGGHLEIGFASGDGSIMVSKSGIVRRLSVRLAKKGVTREDTENVDVVSAKRKKVKGPSLNGKFAVRNLRVSGIDGVPDPIILQSILQDMGDRSVAKLVKEKDKLEDGESFVIENCNVETLNYGIRKRRISMEVKQLGLELCEADVAEKGILSLRSGKRVVKREKRDDSGISGNSLEAIENGGDSDVGLSGDVIYESMSEAKVEDGNNHWKEVRTFGRGEEGIDKNFSETAGINCSAPMNFKLHDSKLSLGDLNQVSVNFTRRVNSKVVAKEQDSIVIKTGVNTRRRLRIEEKGKMKLVGEPSSFSAIDKKKLKETNINVSSASGAEQSATNESLQNRVQERNTNVTVDDARSAYRERFQRIARQNASRFAHFSSQDELGGHAHDVAGKEIPLPDPNSGIEDWPGPFSTAMKIINDREGKRRGGQYSAASDKSEAVELKWTPKNLERKHQKQVPSLIELCLSVLSKNSDAITSLDFVPDALRHKICFYLCDGRRMDRHFLELLLHGSPTEIRIQDCSWLYEELFTKTFEDQNVSKLAVLQLDQCGICMSDHALYAALARSPNCLPALTIISLKDAYRLSDAGLRILVTAAPSLKSIDVSRCPLITSEGICYLASSLGLVLRELYMNNCDGIDAMLILPALQKLEKLEVLSVAGIPTVCDDFVGKFVSVNGCRMKEFVLADCIELTGSALKAIGDACPDLQAVDLMNLCQLTDISIGHLANGCRSIQTLKFCRSAFSDEAIAAYLDVRGATLRHMVLNNISQVSNLTALSLARNCKNLRSLDLSWCRNLSNEALGLIVDSCISLEVLKLFGCSQVTEVLVEGHSNPQVKLIGLKMSPVLEHMDVPDFL